MSVKRPRLAFDDRVNSSTTPARVSLPNLPIEILAEILFYTRSPPTVLAVSRTSSFLYHSLVENPDASFIWRSVRKTCEPAPLPDPGDGWKKSEAAYAAFVFSGGACEVCRKYTREMYLSFSARIRLCGNWHCRRRFLGEVLVNVTAELEGQARCYLCVPPVESTRCFHPSRVGALVWPRGEVMLRRSEWEEFQRDMQAHKDAKQAGTTEKSDEQRRRSERLCAALRRLPEIMETSERLIRWKWDYDRVYQDIKKEHEIVTKRIVNAEGWDEEDLVATQTYGSLQRRKNLLLEEIKSEDIDPIRSAIESELLALKARHQRQKAEATYRERLCEVKKMYERMRCGTLGAGDAGSSSSSEPLVPPPLSVFCRLPSVRVLKGSPDPGAMPPGSTSVTSEINSPLAISLIKTDVHTWLMPVQKHLLTMLGYPNGWQSASTRTLHPLKRVTARFFCRRCGEGNVGRSYQREKCLDFKGVCSHVCKSASRGGGKTSDWRVDVFEKDEKAISFVKAFLDFTGFSEDSPDVGDSIKTLDGKIRCMTCQGWIVMDFDTAIGHAHRHESMRIRLLPTAVPKIAGLSGEDGMRLAFVRGNAELLLGPSLGAKNLGNRVSYGCKHCFVVAERFDAVIGIECMGRAMSFHGLRSHAKEK